MADDTDLQSGIVKARAAGYSDDEIANHLADTVPGIKKARDAGYTNSDIIKHLAGANVDAPAPEPQDSGVSTLGDVAKQAAAGPVAGTVDTLTAIPRLAGALRGAANKYLIDPTLNKVFGPPSVNPDTQGPNLDAMATNAGDKVNEMLPQPQTTAGQYARTVGTMTPNMIGGPETLASRLLTRMAAPGIASEAAGQATAGTAAEPYARIAGAVAGGGIAGAAMAPRQAAQALPDIDAVAAAGKAGYNDPAVQALRVRGGAVNSLGNDISNTLENRGFFREDHGPVFNAVDRLSNAGPSVSFNQLDAVRQALQNHANDIDAFGRATPRAAAATRAKGLLDDFMNTDMTNPNNVLTGNPVAARQAYQQARANSGAAIRADQVAKAISNADNDASVANSGMNIQNRIRQKLKPFIQNDGAKMGGYNDAERAQMRRLVRGSMAMNGLRYAGNAMGGSGMTVGPYVLFGHPAVPAAGWALKKAANMATQHMANSMQNTLLSRAPVVQRVLAANRVISAGNRASTGIGATTGALRALALGLINKPNAP